MLLMLFGGSLQPAPCAVILLRALTCCSFQREKLMAELEDFERDASDPARLFANKVGVSAVY